MRPLRTVRTQKSLAYRTSQLPSGSSRRVLSRVGKKPDREVVVKLDRLGRSTRDVLTLVHELEAQGAALTVLEPAFSTKDAAGPILVTVLGMVDEMERRLIRERQQAGIEAAKAKGVYKGRKPSVPVATVREMRKAGHGPTAIAKALGISRMSVHRVLSGQE